MPRKDSNEIDIELTKQHHNYYGEEADPELARMLAANKKKANGKPAPRNDTSSNADSTDLTVIATEVRNTGIATRSTLATIPERKKNVKIVNDENIGTGNDESVAEDNVKDTTGEAAQTPSSIRITRRNNAICSPLSPNNRGVSDQSTCSKSLKSHDVSVENVPYERLEDDRTTSIPQQPSLESFAEYRKKLRLKMVKIVMEKLVHSWMRLRVKTRRIMNTVKNNYK